MSLLENLYLERAQLTDKLRKLEDLIALYEGRQYQVPSAPFNAAHLTGAIPVTPAVTATPPVPESRILPDETAMVSPGPDAPAGQVREPLSVPEAAVPESTVKERPAPATPPYPLHGTWKDKILFVLGILKRPVVVAEIAARMLELEPGLSEKDLQVTIGQYCSLMGKNGEILTDKTEYRNKYALRNDIQTMF